MADSKKQEEINTYIEKAIEIIKNGINKDTNNSIDIKNYLIEYIKYNEDITINNILNILPRNNKLKLYLNNIILKYELDYNSINNTSFIKSKSKKITKKIVKNLKNNKSFIEELNELISMLSDEQLNIFDSVMCEHNVFITGPAGTGKSLVINAIVKKFLYEGKKIGITSSTGCSALNICGSTLHSFLGIGLGNLPVDVLYNELRTKRTKSKIYTKLKSLEVLIIDEISMINSNLFTLVDNYLKLIKENKKPFGGIQLILSGDFFQLLPIRNNSLCFESDSWIDSKIKILELTKSFRQTNNDFVNILNELRYGNCTDEIIDILNSTKNNKFPSGVTPVKLYTKNKSVDDENIKIMHSLNKKTYNFSINYSNSIFKDKNLSDLEICVGAQVMVTYNIDQENGIVNGRIGLVDSIDQINKSITIKVFDKNNEPFYYQINYISKDSIHYDENEDKIIKTPMYSYIPLKLAYCITVHKCVAENTLIATSNGLIRVKNLIDLQKFQNNTLHNVENKNIIVNTISKFKQYSNISNIFKSCIQNCIVVTTSFGYKIGISESHRILCSKSYHISNANKNEDDLIWINGLNLTTDTIVYLTNETKCYSKKFYPAFDFYEKYININDPNTFKLVSENKNNIVVEQESKIIYPFFIDEELSYFIGIIMFSCVINNCKILFSKIFLEDERIKYTLKEAFNLELKDLKLYNYKLYNFINFFKINSKMLIPDCILQNTIKSQKAFIEAVLKCGKVKNKIHFKLFEYNTFNEHLLIEIQIILLNFGIICERDRNSIKFTNNNYDSLNVFLSLSSYENININSKTIFVDKIKSINVVKYMTYDLTINETHNYIGNGFINHNSQSMTIEYLDIDFKSGAFAPGHGYTSISRGVDLQKMRINNINKSDFFIDERVKNFYNSINKNNDI